MNANNQREAGLSYHVLKNASQAGRSKVNEAAATIGGILGLEARAIVAKLHGADRVECCDWHDDELGRAMELVGRRTGYAWSEEAYRLFADAFGYSARYGG